MTERAIFNRKYTSYTPALTQVWILNGDAVTTSAGATATELPFGTLASGTPVVLGQALTVSTNAKNGFSVTVEADQPLQSSTGGDIDYFKDDNS